MRRSAAVATYSSASALIELDNSEPIQLALIGFDLEGFVESTRLSWLRFVIRQLW